MIAVPSPKPLHVAITRRIKAGHEEEFKAALREFFQHSFAHTGVQGAGLLVPPPGSDSREYGILRTFTNDAERKAFYESPLFKAWKSKVDPITEGEAQYREMTGLEAWFRNSGGSNPPRWKMAFLTFLGVWPVSMAVPATLTPLIGKTVPNVIFAGAVAAGIVLVFTWVSEVPPENPDAPRSEAT